MSIPTETDNSYDLDNYNEGYSDGYHAGCNQALDIVLKRLGMYDMTGALYDKMYADFEKLKK